MHVLLNIMQKIIFIPLMVLATFSAKPAFAVSERFMSLSTHLALHHPDQLAAYLDHLNSLEEQFDIICSDTFCEGEYDNLTPMRFTCVIDTESNTVTDCTWQFAGSYEEVDPDSGEVTLDNKFFTCRLATSTPLEGFLEYIKKAGSPDRPHSTKGILEVLIPGEGKPLWDVLMACL